MNASNTASETESQGFFAAAFRRTILSDRPMLAILLSGLVLRMVFVFAPLNPKITRDSPGYLLASRNLCRHATFSMSKSEPFRPTLRRSPGYPVIIAGGTACFRVSTTFLLFLQALADLFALILAVMLAVRLGGRPAGLLCAVLYGLNPFACAYAATIMTEAASTLILMVVIFLVHRHFTGAALPWWRWALAGLLIGGLTLVRPAIAVLPAACALFCLTKRLRLYLKAMALLAAGYALVVAPWILRNWLVTRSGAADASFAPIATVHASKIFEDLDRPGVSRWVGTFEEPFIWDHPHKAPAVARYFLPKEKQRTEELFKKLRARKGVVTPELNQAFAALARERVRAHPIRCTVFPPLSRAFRLWVTPRLSVFGFYAGRARSLEARLLVYGSVLVNGLVALLAVGFVLVRIRDRLVLWLAMVPFYLTVVHLFFFLANQSRYTAPALPQASVLAAAGVVAIAKAVRARFSRKKKAD